MLTTESYTIGDAIGELDERIETLGEELDERDEGTDEYDTLASRKNRLGYLRTGLQWQRDEEGWDAETDIELGALTAGENALMHREAPDNAAQQEMRLWFVAACTERAPYVGGGLSETFENLAGDGIHPAFVEWAEAKANSLGVPDDVGNRSAASQAETKTDTNSTTEPASTTSSSSPSPTE